MSLNTNYSESSELVWEWQRNNEYLLSVGEECYLQATIENDLVTNCQVTFLEHGTFVGSPVDIFPLATSLTLHRDPELGLRLTPKLVHCKRVGEINTNAIIMQIVGLGLCHKYFRPAIRWPFVPSLFGGFNSPRLNLSILGAGQLEVQVPSCAWNGVGGRNSDIIILRDFEGDRPLLVVRTDKYRLRLFPNRFVSTIYTDPDSIIRPCAIVRPWALNMTDFVRCLSDILKGTYS